MPLHFCQRLSCKSQRSGVLTRCAHAVTQWESELILDFQEAKDAAGERLFTCPKDSCFWEQMEVRG